MICNVSRDSALARRLTLISSCLTLLFLLALTCPAVQAQTATKHWYVSKKGQSGGSGSSWQTAWNEVGSINWSSVNPGDTIVLDGGSAGGSMVYTGPMYVGKSGLYGKPISIVQSQEAGRNGTVIIRGTSSGIIISGKSYINVRGMRWSGIVVENCYTAGINIYPNGTSEPSAKIVITNVEVRNCNSVASPYDSGILIKGTDVTLDHVIVHDNYGNNIQTQFGQGPAIASRLVLDHCWVYNKRVKSTGLFVNTSFDGVYPTVDTRDSIMGPGLTSGVKVGAHAAAEVRCWATLFLNGIGNNIIAQDYSSRVSANNCTSFMTKLNPSGSAHSALNNPTAQKTVANYSIVYGGAIQLPVGKVGNYNTQFAITGNTTALATSLVNPKFLQDMSVIPNNATIDQLISLDFALAPTSSSTGRGTRLTSVQKLLNEPR